jgi:serine/threonine protein kinase
MPFKLASATELDHLSWLGVQERVRSFRQAIARGERPELNQYAPAGTADRKVVLLELLHEEMEYRIKAGEPFALESFLARYRDLANDDHAVSELREAESDLRRRAPEQAEPRLSSPDPGDSAPSSSAGRYELGDVIGQGAFGVVYRAWDTTLNRAVAVKRPRPGALSAPGAVDRFLREARSAGVLRHPNIVPVYDAGEIDGQPYLVSALVEGRNLADELAAGRPESRLAAAWVAALAGALEHAHRAGVIHRDVKPSNILIERDHQVFLTDFGLARSDTGAASLSVDGQLIGTPAYMAPEQTRGESGVIDARTDVYSLGVVLYELLTGVRPFQGSERMLLIRIRDEEPLSPRRLDDTIPRDLETVCLKAIAKLPGHRYPDAASFAADLLRYVRGEPVLARRAGPLGALWRTCRRKPLVCGLAASLVLAVALGFAGVSWQWHRAQLQRDRALRDLASEFSTVSSLMSLCYRDPEHPDDSRRLRQAILDYYRTSLLHQSQAYPELRNSLLSVTLGALNLVDQTAPRDESLDAYRKIVSQLKNNGTDDTTDFFGPYTLAECLGAQGRLLIQMDRVDEGASCLRESVNAWRTYGERSRSIATVDPLHRRAREAWMGTEMALGSIEVRLHRTAQAVAIFERSVTLADELLRIDPNSDAARRRFETEQSLAAVHLELGQIAQAEGWHRRALAHAEELSRHPMTDPVRQSLASGLSQYARPISRDRPVEAIALHRRACKLIESIVREHPGDPGVQEEFSRYVYLLAVAEDRADRTADAAADFRRTISLMEDVKRVKVFDRYHQCQLATSYHVLGRILADGGHAAESIEPYQSAAALREQMSRDDPQNARWHGDCAGSFVRLGEAFEGIGRMRDALEAYQKGLLHQRRIVALEPSELKHQEALNDQMRQVLRLRHAQKHGSRPLKSAEAANTL